MKVVFNSIKFILLSFILLSSTIFIIQPNFNLSIYFNVLRYSVSEIFLLVLIISQLLFIIFSDKIDNLTIVINVLLSTVFYALAKMFIYDGNTIYFLSQPPELLFISREIELNTSFKLTDIQFIKSMLIDIHEWDLNKNDYPSMIVVFLINFSVNYILKKKVCNQLILRVVVFFSLFFFYLYIWNTTLNMAIFIIAIIILRGFNLKNENN